MKKLLIILILSLLLTGCSSSAHECEIKAIRECGKENVGRVFFDLAICSFVCKDYSKYTEE